VADGTRFLIPRATTLKRYVPLSTLIQWGSISEAASSINLVYSNRSLAPKSIGPHVARFSDGESFRCRTWGNLTRTRFIGM